MEVIFLKAVLRGLVALCAVVFVANLWFFVLNALRRKKASISLVPIIFVAFLLWILSLLS